MLSFRRICVQISERINVQELIGSRFSITMDWGRSSLMTWG
jgi:hypothetical protein